MKHYILNILKALLKGYGYEIIVKYVVYEWQRHPQEANIHKLSRQPAGAESYLQEDNPRLKEIESRYAHFDSTVTTPLEWEKGIISSEDMLYFRGDNAFFWQRLSTNMNELSAALTMYYTRSIDKFGLLDMLEEDDCFGNLVYNIDDKIVSRDLLDSINEMYFLEKHLKIFTTKDLTVLDIGAGYGRLAHRMVCALPNISEYLCADAFAKSTFISEYYLRFRNLEERAKVIPLYEIENAIQGRTVDIAVNINSFPECTISSIEWWISILTKYKVKYLMIVPTNGDKLQTNDEADFSCIIEKAGYKLKAKEPKYSDPIVQQYSMSPAWYYLFEFCEDKII